MCVKTPTQLDDAFGIDKKENYALYSSSKGLIESRVQVYTLVSPRETPFDMSLDSIGAGNEG